jgi:hypothetical protein
VPTGALKAADMVVKAPPLSAMVPGDWAGYLSGNSVDYAANTSASTTLDLAGRLAADQQNTYSLFNPTPEKLMRELMTDRPDNTESPFTVNPGHLQFETTLYGYARSYPDIASDVSDSGEFGTTNIRLGLTNSSEVNAIWQPYGSVQTRRILPTRRASRASADWKFAASLIYGATTRSKRQGRLRSVYCLMSVCPPTAAMA